MTIAPEPAALPDTTATRMDILDVLRGVAIFVAQTVARALRVRITWFGPADSVWRQFTSGRRVALRR
jgi:uncharacterized membrane protein YeiB